MSALTNNTPQVVIEHGTFITDTFTTSPTADCFYSNALLAAVVDPDTPSIINKELFPVGTKSGAFVGLCVRPVTNNPGEKKNLVVMFGGRILKVFITGATCRGDVGRIVFCETDNIGDLTLTPVGSPIGIVRRHHSSSVCDVELFFPEESAEQMWRVEKKT